MMQTTRVSPDDLRSLLSLADLVHNKNWQNSSVRFKHGEWTVKNNQISQMAEKHITTNRIAA
jgi:hypothetical protein